MCEASSYDRKSACQPKGWRTVFDFLSAMCDASSYDRKSACQPKGWRTVFDFLSAKICIIWYFVIQGTK